MVPSWCLGDVLLALRAVVQLTLFHRPASIHSAFFVCSLVVLVCSSHDIGAREPSPHLSIPAASSSCCRFCLVVCRACTATSGAYTLHCGVRLGPGDSSHPRTPGTEGHCKLTYHVGSWRLLSELSSLRRFFSELSPTMASVSPSYPLQYSELASCFLHASPSCPPVPPPSRRAGDLSIVSPRCELIAGLSMSISRVQQGWWGP